MLDAINLTSTWDKSVLKRNGQADKGHTRNKMQ
jgi:hypothetical protein